MNDDGLSTEREASGDVANGGIVGLLSFAGVLWLGSEGPARGVIRLSSESSEVGSDWDSEAVELLTGLQGSGAMFTKQLFRYCRGPGQELGKLNRSSGSGYLVERLEAMPRILVEAIAWNMQAHRGTSVTGCFLRHALDCANCVITAVQVRAIKREAGTGRLIWIGAGILAKSFQKHINRRIKATVKCLEHQS